MLLYDFGNALYDFGFQMTDFGKPPSVFAGSPSDFGTCLYDFGPQPGAFAIFYFPSPLFRNAPQLPRGQRSDILAGA